MALDCYVEMDDIHSINWMRVMQQAFLNKELDFFREMRAHFSTIDIFEILDARAFVDIESNRLRLNSACGVSVVMDFSECML
jgi:hypothetical protein